MMPVIFVGHGSPMNAIEENEFSRKWRELGKVLPKPKAIVCVSAHWETEGKFVTAMDAPKTIHDFGGFPKELYEARYPAKGNLKLAKEIEKKGISLDNDWGLDHGCWSVLIQMYPKADIPVVQVSLDYNLNSIEHYKLAKKLLFLREKDVLIICSGNMVHNLSLVEFRTDFNESFGFEWAKHANELFKKLIIEGRHEELVEYDKLGSEVSLAINSAEHYLPMLYALSLKHEGDKITFFNDKLIAGSISMTSFILSERKY